MVKTILVTTLFLILNQISFAQYQYDASPAFPFGRPNPEAPGQIKDYAPMIGICDCKSESRNPDQTWATPVDMAWRFKYIMNGMGVQDETLKTDGKHSGSIRQFSADSARWYVHYYSSASVATTLGTWEGNKTTEGDIVLYRESKAPNGMDGFYRLTFYEIKKEGFKWVGEWVNLDESIVYPTWKIACQKRKTDDNG